MFWTEHSEQHPGPSITFDCPRCRREGVVGTSYEERRQDKYLGIIPLPASYRTWVTCSACKRTIPSSVVADRLVGLTPEELKKVIRPQADFIQKFMAGTAILLCPIPMLGLIFATFAVLCNALTPSGSRKLSLIALGISVVIHLLFAGYMLATTGTVFPAS